MHTGIRTGTYTHPCLSRRQRTVATGERTTVANHYRNPLWTHVVPSDLLSQTTTHVAPSHLLSPDDHTRSTYLLTSFPQTTIYRANQIHSHRQTQMYTHNWSQCTHTRGPIATHNRTQKCTHGCTCGAFARRDDLKFLSPCRQKTKHPAIQPAR
jgi:hypothetical protein